MGIFSEVLSCTTSLKELFASEKKVSDICIKVDSSLTTMTVKNIGSAYAHNICITFKDTSWSNPFENYSFELSPNESEDGLISVLDYDTDTATVEVSWTDETQGDFYKSVIVGYRN